MKKFPFNNFKEKVLESPVKFICGGIAVVLALAGAITLMPPLGIAAAVFGIISFACEFAPTSHVDENADSITQNDNDIDYDLYFIFDTSIDESNISTQTDKASQNEMTDHNDIMAEVELLSDCFNYEI